MITELYEAPTRSPDGSDEVERIARAAEDHLRRSHELAAHPDRTTS